MTEGLERKQILLELSQMILAAKEAFEELESLKEKNKLDQEFYAMQFERIKQKLIYK